MSKLQPGDGEPIVEATIVFELPPSAQGTYQYEREDGATVYGDASGEWTLGKNGDLEDIVFFASPRSMGYGKKAE